MIWRQTIKKVTDMDIQWLDQITSAADEHAFGARGVSNGADFHLVESFR